MLECTDALFDPPHRKIEQGLAIRSGWAKLNGRPHRNDARRGLRRGTALPRDPEPTLAVRRIALGRRLRAAQAKP